MVKKKQVKKKKFYEIFRVKKKGKEKTVKVKGTITEEKPTKKQIKEENKILRNIFIGVGILFLLIIGGFFAIDNIRHYEYKGIDFETVKFCDVKPCLILQQTTLPVVFNGEKTLYNFYFRNDPRELKEIPFDGEINLLPNMVINSEGDLNCDGDGVIAVANLVKLYEVIGAKVVKNGELKCTSTGAYIYLNIREANETSIEQTSTMCYNINVNNCEILEVTERFMVETFSKVNSLI